LFVFDLGILVCVIHVLRSSFVFLGLVACLFCVYNSVGCLVVMSYVFMGCAWFTCFVCLNGVLFVCGCLICEFVMIV